MSDSVATQPATFRRTGSHECGSPPATRGRLIDIGRVVVVVLFALTLMSAGARAVQVVGEARSPLATWLEIVTSILTMTFCAVVLVAYLRRGSASATDRGVAVWLAAPAATCLPFVVPVLPTTFADTTRAVAAVCLIVAGMAWSVWAVTHLSTNLSVVPQARQLVDTGPYRLVRHPLYLGELVAAVGFAVRGGHWSHGAVLTLLLALQLFRASREEALLGREVSGYTDYAARTWRIVPGLR
jgi:protein-S-isoprenylcysteine O-methyltransferase Ste14